MTHALILIFALLAVQPPAQAGAEDGGPSIEHPEVYLLDREGKDVLATGGPVSPMNTCGACHDTGFIARHSYHSHAGYNEISMPCAAPEGRPWDISPGLFGRWEPVFYRYLTPELKNRPDLGTPEWIMALGHRHVGGGPAVKARSGISLTELPPDPVMLESFILDAESLDPIGWNWKDSGVVELNCFLCHIADPDNEARKAAIRDSLFEWAATATLERTGLVARRGPEWVWIEEAFNEYGATDPARLALMPPSSAHCGQCHGLVHTTGEPVVASYGEPLQWSTETKGQIFSAQLLSRSGMNLEDKADLDAPWDVHAEWLLKCSDCHFPPNYPSHAQPKAATEGALRSEGPRLAIEEFLTTPDHNFAKGWTAQGTVADHLDGAMRRCEECHNAHSSHDWLPYKRRHMSRLMCEACHVPEVRAPARRVTDWTVLTLDGGPRIEYRGVRGEVADPAAFVEGYRPVILPREDVEGGPIRLGPYNLVTSWYWVFDDPPHPVRLYDLERAYLSGGSYHPDVIAALDSDGSGDIEEDELLLDTEEKAAAVASRLESLGLTSPRIRGEIQPYGLHHGVSTGRWATRDCSRCHSDSPGIAFPFELAAAAPAAAIPSAVADANVFMGGEIEISEGAAIYIPATIAEGFYVLGHDRWVAIDTAGAIVVVATLAGVLVHGGLRIFMRRKRRKRR